MPTPSAVDPASRMHHYAPHRFTAADRCRQAHRSLTRVSASTKRRGAVIPFAQQAQSGARGAQI
ncbi:uncharacterized protein CPUR_04231 [Claviceps purpurea 20.1]|uniref:Uncharacterized protein n=1 Tax=Claviceps purpurea (strain 20.1) TaxID=1111077 RepID=M1WAC7_CLAP2|nr:uncharacterized protein CPUR_04231 [Claviceps purpurea 20.1]